MLEQQNNKRT